MASQLLAIGSDLARRQKLHKMRTQLANALRLIADGVPGHPQLLYTAYALLLRTKGMNGTLERLHRQFGQVDADSREAIRLREVRGRLATIALAHFSKDTALIDTAEIEALATERERLEYELTAQTDPAMAENLFESEDVVSVAMGLPEGSVLIDFVRLRSDPGRGMSVPDRYVAFTLAAQNPYSIALHDLGDAAAIDNLINGFLTEVAKDPRDALSSSPWRNVGTELRQRVFDPLLPVLKQINRVVLSPDSSVSLLPFDVLPGYGEGQFLIDRYTFSYVASGREAIRFGSRSADAPSSPIVLGGPDYNLGRSDTRRAEVFRPLAAAETEARHVTELFGVEPLTGGAATKSALLDARSPQVLHVSTHGYFFHSTDLPAAAGWLRDQPTLCGGMILAGANAAMAGELLPPALGNGIVTPEDVMRMDLLHTELVVLSTCVSGVGDVGEPGEGVRGFRNAFFAAGAWSIVMSLWEVPDKVTAELVGDFYQRLLTGESRLNALRSAQLAIKAHHPQPGFWAGFVCQEIPGPMTIANNAGRVA